jgi:hypothetical protein
MVPVALLRLTLPEPGPLFEVILIAAAHTFPDIAAEPKNAQRAILRISRDVNVPLPLLPISMIYLLLGATLNEALKSLNCSVPVVGHAVGAGPLLLQLIRPFVFLLSSTIEPLPMSGNWDRKLIVCAALASLGWKIGDVVPETKTIRNAARVRAAAVICIFYEVLRARLSTAPGFKFE